MKKIVAVELLEDSKVIYQLGDSVPNNSNVLCLNLPVKVNNDKILSNMTKGRIIGFSYSAKKALLAHVHWLEGAPPLRIRVESVVSAMPKKFWMVNPSLPEGNNTYSGTSNRDGQRAGTSMGRTKYYDKDEAIRAALELHRIYGHEYIILESAILSNGTELFAL